MVIKRYENNDIVMDELSLYNMAMHKEKTPSHTNLNASERGGAQYDSVKSGYKVKDLIHSTQENDWKLLELDEKDDEEAEAEGYDAGERRMDVLRSCAYN